MYHSVPCSPFNPATSTGSACKTSRFVQIHVHTCTNKLKLDLTNSSLVILNTIKLKTISHGLSFLSFTIIRIFCALASLLHTVFCFPFEYEIAGFNFIYW